MAQSSSFLVSSGMINVLLVSAGLLMTLFDWSAARRREFLYLYFAEDKPGVNYFAAARRRRAQYTRLLVAFGILFCTEFIAAQLLITMSDVDQIRMWLHFMRLLGLAALGMAFIYRPDPTSRINSDTLFLGFLTIWVVGMGLLFGRALGSHPADLVINITRGIQVLLTLILCGVVWHRGDEDLPMGLLSISQKWLLTAFLVWGIGPITGFALESLISFKLSQIAVGMSYLILVMAVAKGVLTDYENIEGSRHRLGRERQVIVSYLQRIGSAFTTSVEVEGVLEIILESALETTEAAAGAIYLYHTDTKLLEPRVVLNFFPPLHIDTPAAFSPHRTEELEEEMKHQAFRLGEGVIGSVAQEGRARIVNDVRADGIMLGTTTDFMRNRSMLLVPLKIRDEPLGVMAVLNKQRGSFTTDDQFLLQALADQGALSINNAMLTTEVRQQERLKRDLQIARDIQQRLQPERCPIVPGFELAARGSSATEVGGDYYDFFWVDEDRLGIVVADVSGKGVPAALTVAMMRSVFRTQAKGNRDVRDVLARVNEFMGQDLRRDMFITCTYGILEISSRRFSWARAGHEPLIVAHPNAPSDVLSPDGFALGVIDSPTFEEMLEIQTVELHSGDRLLIFTDGLTEAMNAKGEEFGMERILEVMNHEGDYADGSPAREAALNEHALQHKDKAPCAPELTEDDPEDLKSIEFAVHTHVGNEPQSDDLTIVYIGAK
jgi:sigma-B regulation protein RsbU (phosphoserine phosphatase)